MAQDVVMRGNYGRGEEGGSICLKHTSERMNLFVTLNGRALPKHVIAMKCKHRSTQYAIFGILAIQATAKDPR